MTLTVREKTFPWRPTLRKKSFIPRQPSIKQFQCRHKRRIYMWAKKFREQGTALKLMVKGRRDNYSERSRITRSPVNINAIKRPRLSQSKKDLVAM